MADDATLEAIQREIKSFGGDVKALGDSMRSDLEAVRKVAEEAKTAAGRPEVKAQIDALSTSVTEKQAALEARLDEVEKKANRARLGGADAEGEFKAARDFLTAAGVMRGEIKAGAVLPDERVDLEAFKSYRSAFPAYLRRGEGAQGVDMKAMSVGSDPEGGWWVTPAVGQTINGVIFESSPMRQVANVVTISTSEIEFPRDDDEASAGWVGEQEDRTETGTPKAGMQRIPVHELYANPKLTQKLLEDASFDVTGWLAGKIGEKLGRLEGTAFVKGSGVKQPRGFTTYASGTYSAGSSGKIEQVAAGTGGAVGFDDLINLQTSLKEYYLAGASWMLQRASVGAILLLKDGDGQYLWRPNNEAGKPSMLLGYPVRQGADMDPIAASKLPIAFGNFAMGYMIVDRIGITTLRDPYSAKPFVQFYTRKRVGGDVVNFEAIKLLAT